MRPFAPREGVVIPYIEVGPFVIFGLPLHLFGAIVGLSIVVGSVLGARAARRYHPGDDVPLTDMIPWGVAGGVFVGHLVHVLAYYPEVLQRDGPIALLRFWDGLTSSGGIVGSALTAAIYFRIRKIPLSRYLDALALGMAPGWSLSRVGCFFAHDHPGIRSELFFAVRYPGGARLDLGLIEVFVLGAIAALLYVLARRQRKEGFLMGVLALTYGVARFFLDFLRATDVPHEVQDRRYLGLTPAQYLCFALVGIGLFLLLRAAPPTSPTAVPPAGEPAKEPPAAGA